MIVNVSQVSGMLGMNSCGRLWGSAPWSPTVGTAMESVTVATVMRTIATSGAGTTFVNRGMTTMMMMPAATSG